jgi:hypothetical protein
MRRKKPSVATTGVLVALALAMVLPAYAHATTVRLGNPNLAAAKIELMCFSPAATCGAGTTFAQGFISETTQYFAPAAGVITNWRVVGGGTLKLRIVESGGEGGWIGRGTSAAASHTGGESNATDLPIGAGDLIGVDFPSEPLSGTINVEETASAETLRWHPALSDNGPELEPARIADALALNAEVVLTPVISSLSPSSGSTTGGSAVKIGGLYLDGATSVTFGSKPASSFSVDSSTQITAIVPATGASTVDVRVTGPGGSSEVRPVDRYTFMAPAATPTTLVQGGLAVATTKPAVSGFSESASRWRRGRSLPRISTASNVPVGTTFSFNLNEPVTTTLTFTRSAAGRRTHGKCAAPSPGNAHSPKCKRTVVVGSFGVSGKAGQDKVRFQGRVSNAKTLKPGAYAVSVTARDAHGLKAISRSLPFTIVS